jgi:hypothetical protein
LEPGISRLALVILSEAKDLMAIANGMPVEVP